jgi:hypothetical protein
MDASVQWADSLLALERLFFLKLAVWGALSVIVGTGLLALARRDGQRSSLLSSLALTLITAGSIELIAALLCRHGARLRDLGAATSLDRALWMVAGIALGWTSAAVLIGARSRSRMPAASAIMGMATAIAVHGAAIAILALQLAFALVR